MLHSGGFCRTTTGGNHSHSLLSRIRAGIDEKKHTIGEMTRMLLSDILPHEMSLRRKKQLPAEAAPPQLTQSYTKTLGTADPDALRIESTSLFDVSQLLVKAQAERARREAAGISDRVEVAQPPRPAFDTKLVGKVT